MQGNNTEKRIIRRMKRTFHGHRIKKTHLATGYVLDLNQAMPYWIILLFKTSMSIPDY